jgi:outer membrane protein assembly factor BamB
MPLKTVCPSCQTEYQLSPTMLGRQMRCPRSDCRAVFTVTEPPPPVEERPKQEPPAGGSPPSSSSTPEGPPPGSRPGSGTVGELGLLLPSETALPETAVDLGSGEGNGIPVLPAEEAAPAAEAPHEASWHETPTGPVHPASRRKSGPNGQKRVREFSAGDWQTHAPPPRRGRAAEEVAAEMPVPEGPYAESGEPLESPAAVLTEEEPFEEMAAEPGVEEESVEEYTPPKSARWSRRIILLFVLLAVAVLGAGVLLVRQTWWDREEKLAKEAYQAYDGRQYRTADRQFTELLNTFSTSDRKDEYELMQKLSVLRADVKDGQAETKDLLDQVARFAKDHAKQPHIQERGPDVGKALAKVIDNFARQNEEVKGTEPRAVIDRAQEVMATVSRLSKDALPRDEEKRLQELLDRVAGDIDSWEEYERAVQEIVDLRGPECDVIPKIEDLQKAYAKRFPKILDEPRIDKRLEELRALHLAGIQYTTKGFDAQPPRGNGAEGVSILFDPLTDGKPPISLKNEEVKLALARGVLYGLRKGDGEVSWAMRVGIDTTTLPVRVPESLVTPERILVVSRRSGDIYTLTALAGDGGVEWVYRLSGPSLGRPVIVGNRALVATWDGQVHEVELVQGGCVGRWIIGQRFTVGGTFDPHTNLAYFPAEHSFVYVLDVETKQVKAILHSGHPSGSLRGEAVVIPEQQVFLAGQQQPWRRPGYLVLPQAPGLNEVQLRVFKLPIKDRHARALNLKPVPHVPGWTWFKPFQDGERLGMLSDEGVLGLFGISQVRNKDKELFPLLDKEGVDLRPFLGGRERADARGLLGRAQVVQAQGNDFWVLASGMLQRLQLGWQGAAGRQIVAGWQQPVEVGSPLHAAQVEEDPVKGRSTLYVVTRSLKHHACQATAVDDETGKVLWQRQLGVVCEGDPVLLQPGPLQPPVVLMQDEGGSLFALNPARFPKAKSGWLPGGQTRLAGAFPVAEDHPPLLFPGPEGSSAYQLVFTREDRAVGLRLRNVFFGRGGRLQVIDRKAKLRSPLAGQPAVMGRWLVLPLANGILARMALPEPGAVRPLLLEDNGPLWRGKLSPPGRPGHALALGGDLLLTTDGGRGLTVWRWAPSKGKFPDRLTDSQEVTPPLEGRITSPPVLVDRPGRPEDPVRVCVADSTEYLVLLRIDGQGRVTKEQSWPVNGRVSDGPFVRRELGGPRIGCVVNGSRLVWLDPDRKDPLWSYSLDSSVVGRPGIQDGLVIVAQQSGWLMALDAEHGTPVGPGYLLPGTVVPAANPVPFGAGRLLVPLSDGTARLLPLATLREEKKK